MKLRLITDYAFTLLLALVFLFCLVVTGTILVQQAHAKENQNVQECIAYIEARPLNQLLEAPHTLTSALTRERVDFYCRCMAGKMETNGVLIEKDAMECSAISRLYEVSDF